MFPKLKVCCLVLYFEIKVCDDVVERVQVFKYLGVYMDINLNWHTHVEKLSKKISSKIGILRRVKPFSHY